ncbi:MAG: hypothetical protein LC795_02925 [Acidobacteria bacterium]|nr:hypothetical protein [Acidobacteriota bacterium]
MALTTAEQTKTNTTVSAEFGHVGYIADRARAHVALHGAISGSHLATAMVAASQVPGLKQLASLIVNKMQCQSSYANLAPHVNGSILLDLIPQMAQAPSPVGWRDHVNSVPVPVLTVAGGHPGGTAEWTPLFKQGLHKGLDDGVLTMDSQCGNPNLAHTWPSRTTAIFPLIYKPRLFDLGIAFPRGVGYFVDETFLTPSQTFAAGCIPFVTPNGMLTPKALILNQSVSPLNRYNNHYSFIQTASGHYAGPRGLQSDPYGTGANYAPPNYNYEPTLGTPNSEEVRALTSSFPYTSGLVSAGMKNIVQEHVRGRKVTFTIKLFGKKWTRTWWIWKRTYHLLDGFETKTECDYVYDYVLKP